MSHPIEPKISLLIPEQFPDFVKERGPLFVQFVKSYYEWLEEEDNALFMSRKAMSFRDIDETLEKYLVHFQQKYLYGIPFSIIANKRLLLKHVLDVYRSKGSIQGYKLLFRLVYNEDCDIYLPGVDVLRVSDGKWKDVKFLEVTYSEQLEGMIGETVYGTSSLTTAVVENMTTEYVNDNKVIRLFISNIQPYNGDFVIGEKIINQNDSKSDDLPTIIKNAAEIIGSLDSIEIINGAKDFKTGDLVKIASKSLTTNEKISFGVGGVLKVTETLSGRGQIDFSILDSGSGYTLDSNIMIYNSANDSTGTGASFSLGSYFDTELITYNTDVISSYLTMQLNEAVYGLPRDVSANLSSTLETGLNYETKRFGSISSLSTVRVGTFYTEPVKVFVRSVITSEEMPGTISYNSGCTIITGTGTSFSSWVSANDTICIVGDTANSSTTEFHVVETVSNNTQLILHGKPSGNSTANSAWKVAVGIYPANFTLDDPRLVEEDGSIPGKNLKINGAAVTGNGVVSKTKAIVSGRGYVNNEEVKMYLYGALTTPVILSGGNGYSNGESLIFNGGEPQKIAKGTIITDSNGAIDEVSFSYAGAGYKSSPTITVRTINGTGAVLTTSVTEFNDLYEITGKVKKTAIGRDTGQFLTTDGFLNSDKYIHDSYYYQDFSYQINAPLSLDKYQQILYETFHSAGAEMFGSVQTNRSNTMNISIASDPQNFANSAIVDLNDFNTADISALTADVDFVSVDLVSDTAGVLYGISYVSNTFVIANTSYSAGSGSPLGLLLSITKA